jgi:hypothetical protein
MDGNITPTVWSVQFVRVNLAQHIVLIEVKHRELLSLNIEKDTSNAYSESFAQPLLTLSYELFDPSMGSLTKSQKPGPRPQTV